MTEIHIRVNGDESVVNRARSVLAREGIPIADVRSGESGAESEHPEGRARTAALVRRIEELERTVIELRGLDASKSQFLTNVSHELRTPLTAIVTYGEVLRDGLLGDLNDRQVEAVVSLIGSGRQLLEMIEEVLTYARTNARTVEFDPRPTPAADLIADVRAMNAALISQKSIRFEHDVPETLPELHVDRDKVVHILGNLVGNAIEFTPEGGKISILGRLEETRSGWVRVEVHDTGIGIDPKHHEMIFEEFAQVDASSSRRHHGTGLGLCIARNFVRLHGGKIWVESAVGEGSTFCFTLPCAGDEETAP